MMQCSLIITPYRVNYIITSRPDPIFVLYLCDPIFVLGQRAISGSPVGSPASLETMLDFVARHEIKPVVETYRFDQVNEALARLASSEARYRIVLSHAP